MNMTLERGILITVESTEKNSHFPEIINIIKDTINDIAQSFSTGSQGEKILRVNGRFRNNDQEINKDSIAQEVTQKISHLAKDYTVDVSTTSA